MEEIIELWKEKNIGEVKFEFMCGGDQMDETYFEFYDKDGEDIEIDEEIENYLNERIYKEVNFYEVTDGSYLGESGTVSITLNEDENDFTFHKDSKFEIIETEKHTIYVGLTEEEYNFLNENVDSIIYDENSLSEEIEYKKDIVITKEKENLIKELINKFIEHNNKISFENTGDEEMDSFNIKTFDDDEDEEKVLTFNENKELRLIVSRKFQHFYDSDDYYFG